MKRHWILNESTSKIPSTIGPNIGPLTETECDMGKINQPFDRKGLNLWVGSIYVPSFKYVRVLYICKFLQIWQGSEYASGCIYEKVLIFQDSKYARFLRMQALHKVLNMPEYDWKMSYGRVLNMLGQCFTRFKIILWYESVTLGAKYAWISLNMS